mmetsp:Transcript_71220/g.183614  ORF Transcript_71220/g.183614 Transcript_71220/m.183614 type:complete len:220 (+) Transcript_71220:94-753(+)
MAWCKACSSSDPTSDTVRVNMPVVREEEEMAAKLQAAQEEKARLQAEAEAAAARERLAKEAEEKRRAAEEAEARRVAEEKRRAQEAAAAEERERQERELQQRRAEEAASAERQLRELEKQAADTAKANAWLKKNGFTDVSAKKKSLFGSSFPLHAAVKENDAEIIRCLLVAGADASIKNSSGQTPSQLAAKSDKKGSHMAAITALGSPPATDMRACGGA